MMFNDFYSLVRPRGIGDWCIGVWNDEVGKAYENDCSDTRTVSVEQSLVLPAMTIIWLAISVIVIVCCYISNDTSRMWR